MMNSIEASEMAESMLNDELVSIIIPVYNAEKYLEKLIESIFAQTHKNIEVIAAYESASTDNTLEVLHDLAKKYPLIISIGSERCPGGTRNRGFEYATGEFVVFVDADDYLLPDYLSSFLHVFREHPELDVVSCGYHIVDEDADLIFESNFASDVSYCILNRDTWIKRLLSGKEHVALWHVMIRRSFIQKHGLVFSTLHYAEDTLYQYTLATLVEEIGIVNRKTYVYIMHASGICGSLPVGTLLNPSISARVLIPDVLKTVSSDYAQVYHRMIVSGAVYETLNLDYDEWRTYLNMNNIHSIYPNKYHTNIREICASLLFNISKKAFYYSVMYYRKLRR